MSYQRIITKASFNPRTPRGVRLSALSRCENLQVSIHAPLAECDISHFYFLLFSFSFNPRTPRGVRQLSGFEVKYSVWFQSTHPSRSATVESLRDANILKVSIHAPLAECDIINNKKEYTISSFNPRTPRGVRHVFIVMKWLGFEVSIHAPLAECA